MTEKKTLKKTGKRDAIYIRSLSANTEHRHQGRSDFARKIGGYVFQHPAYTKISHPVDIYYFQNKKFAHLEVRKSRPTDEEIIDKSADKNSLLAFERSKEYLRNRSTVYSFYKPIGGS